MKQLIVDSRLYFKMHFIYLLSKISSYMVIISIYFTIITADILTQKIHKEIFNRHIGQLQAYFYS